MMRGWEWAFGHTLEIVYYISNPSMLQGLLRGLLSDLHIHIPHIHPLSEDTPFMKLSGV